MNIMGLNPVYWYMMLVVCLIAALIGFAVKRRLDNDESVYEITNREYWFALVAIIALLAPGSIYVGSDVARNNLKSFRENINTYVNGVSITAVTCQRDGICRHTYACDPYEVRYSCDRDGDGEKDERCTRTEYHSCPYCTEEWTVAIHTDADIWSGRNPVIATGVLPLDANSYRWRQNKEVPESLIAANQIPQIYWNAFANLQNGTEAQPFVFRRQYNSYTLAANVDSPDAWLDEISLLEQNRLIPTFQTAVTAEGQALRVYVKGTAYDNNQQWIANWNNALMPLDSVFGTHFQGDLHIVIINKGGIDMSMEAMLNAIKYQWQDKEIYGDNTLAKNGVLVILETKDNVTIDRAGLITGMPEEIFEVQYNDDLREAVATGMRNEAIPLTPEAVLGDTSIPFMPLQTECNMFTCFREVSDPSYGAGVLTQLITGAKNPDLAFQRISMSASDPDDVGPGFVDLDSLIVPTGEQIIWIIFGAVIVSCFAWVVVVLMGERRRNWPNRMWKL